MARPHPLVYQALYPVLLDKLTGPETPDSNWANQVPLLEFGTGIWKEPERVTGKQAGARHVAQGQVHQA